MTAKKAIDSTSTQNGPAAKKPLPSTAQLQTRFLDLYRRLGVVAPSARQAGIDRTVVYQWIEKFPSFREAFESAHEEAIDSAEAEVVRRGVLGWNEGVWHRGERCGEERKYSDACLLGLLKARRPSKWAGAPQKLELTGRLTVDSVEARLRAMAVADRQRLRALLVQPARSLAESQELHRLKVVAGLEEEGPA